MSFFLAGFYLGGAAGIILGIYVVAMLVGGIYSLVKLAQAPSTGRGATAIGGAFAISFVIFVGLSGLCYAGLSLNQVVR